MKKFLWLSIIVELGFGLVWLVARNYPSQTETAAYELGIFSLQNISYGLLMTLPLFLFNVILLKFLVVNFKAFEVFTYLKNEVVGPLASKMTLVEIILVSLAAGIGEELLFRGVLLPYLGVTLSSLAFGAVHFVSFKKRFILPIIIYSVAGAYFCFIYYQTDSLASPIVTHVVYDFLILFWLKKTYKSIK